QHVIAMRFGFLEVEAAGVAADDRDGSAARPQAADEIVGGCRSRFQDEDSRPHETLLRYASSVLRFFRLRLFRFALFFRQVIQDRNALVVAHHPYRNLAFVTLGTV